MSCLDSFFTTIRYINLDNRKDRKEQVERSLLSVGVSTFKRFSAVETQTEGGYKGCALSHLKVIEEAKENNDSNILIFEDDVEFINFDEEEIRLSLEQLPEDWDIIYLGANVIKPMTIYSDNLFKLSGAYSTVAYAVNNRCFDKILDHNFYWMDNQQKPTTRYKCIDTMYSGYIIPNNNVYHMNPLICIQSESFSDIQNKVTNYSYLNTRFLNKAKKATK